MLISPKSKRTGLVSRKVCDLHYSCTISFSEIKHEFIPDSFTCITLVLSIRTLAFYTRFRGTFCCKISNIQRCVVGHSAILSTLRLHVVVKVTVRSKIRLSSQQHQAVHADSTDLGFFIMFVISVFFRQVLQGNHVSLQLKRMVRQ